MATEFTKEFSSVLNGMEKERIARENKKEQALLFLNRRNLKKINCFTTLLLVRAPHQINQPPSHNQPLEKLVPLRPY